MGIQTLVENVRTYLNALPEFEDAVVLYGRKEVTKQTNQSPARADGVKSNRVVICPSRTPGDFDSPRGPGQARSMGPSNVLTDSVVGGVGRPLRTIALPYEVHCWAWVGGTDTNSEQVQDDAALVLACATMAGIYRSPHGGVGAFELRNPRFVDRPVELRHGSEFVFDYVAQIRVTDRPPLTRAIVAADTTMLLVSADGETTILEETFTTPPP